VSACGEPVRLGTAPEALEDGDASSAAVAPMCPAFQLGADLSKADLGVTGAARAPLVMFAQGAADLALVSTHVRTQMIDACLALTHDFGGEAKLAPRGDTVAMACGQAADAIAASPLRAGAPIAIALITPSICASSADRYIACVTACRGVDGCEPFCASDARCIGECTAPSVNVVVAAPEGALTTDIAPLIQSLKTHLPILLAANATLDNGCTELADRLTDEAPMIVDQYTSYGPLGRACVTASNSTSVVTRGDVASALAALMKVNRALGEIDLR
jgi:hypothetical protein